MYKIVLASRNKNKIAELETLLSKITSVDIKVLSLDDIGFEGDIVEDGETYEENSVIKSSVPASKGYIGIADDSGLSVECLGGAPGVFSARYAGEHVSYADNNEKLLREMSGVSDRSAKFVCVMSIVIPDSCGISVPDNMIDREMSAFASERAGESVKAVVLRGECPGVITEELRGSDGFGYDPLFYVESLGKTFAEMSHEEKNSVSHRGNAVAKAIDAIEKIFA